MISLAPGTKVFLACRPIDLRCGFNGLAAKVQQMILGSRSRDTRVESVAQISGLQKTDSGRVSMTWQGARLPQSPP